jgi:hypothetical protein
MHLERLNRIPIYDYPRGVNVVQTEGYSGGLQILVSVVWWVVENEAHLGRMIIEGEGNLQ